jgi:hypothetical protein
MTPSRAHGSVDPEASWGYALRPQLPELPESRQAGVRRVAERIAPLLPAIRDVDADAFSPACGFDAGWSYADDR